MYYKEYDSCRLCPRECGVNRNKNITGFCGQKAVMKVGRASLHQWEEPCISGNRGSGTVFFAGCTMRCCYCQNYPLSQGGQGVEIDEKRLTDVFLSLQKEGAHNINLVTAEHFAPQIRESILLAKKEGLKIPVILNSSGYVNDEVLNILQDVIDIFLVDFKYMDSSVSKKYSMAVDYPNVAKNAVERMHQLCPQPVFDSEGLLKKGVLIRHLCLPGHTEDSKNVIKYVYSRYTDSIIFSIMSQYTPVRENEKHTNLSETIKPLQYDSIIDFCISIGMENAYIQEGDSASESFIPEFNGEGIIL